MTRKTATKAYAKPIRQKKMIDLLHRLADTSGRLTTTYDQFSLDARLDFMGIELGLMTLQRRGEISQSWGPDTGHRGTRELHVQIKSPAAVGPAAPRAKTSWKTTA